MKKFFKKMFLIIILLNFSSPGFLMADIGKYYVKKYFQDTMAIKGYTGYIITPACEVVKHKNYNLGIHEYNASFNCGLIPRGEIGFTVKVDEINMLEKMELNAKYMILPFKEDLNKLKLSIGIKNHTPYLMGGKHFFCFYHFGLQGGIGFDNPENSQLKAIPFVSFYKVIYKSMFVLDYDDYEKQCNIGVHFLLSPKLKLDIFIINLNKKFTNILDNMIFGLSFTG
ncbi:hypothetical protein KAU39_03385 [bacterium]|nr:hypothetical protein [bacterium]